MAKQKETQRVAPPPSQSQLSGGSDNNMAEPAWKNWFSEMHETLDSNGLLEQGGDVKGYPFMKYSGSWTSRPYGYNEVVVDMPWTYVCQNKNGCYSRPSPQPIGPSETDHDGSGMNTEQFLGLVKTGHQYTFCKSGEVTQIEVFVPEVTAATTYDLYVINETDPDKPIVTPHPDLTLTANTWTSIAVGSTLISEGQVYSIVLYSMNSSPGTTFDGGWLRAGNSNAGEPAFQAYNRDTQNNILRVSYTDLDGINKETELLSAIPGTEVFVQNTADNTQHVTYGVSSTTNRTTSVEYGVNQEAVGPNGEPPTGATSRITFTVPVPSNTQYSVNPGGWSTQPDFATVVGLFEQAGVGTQGSTDIYGIRITFQEYEGNPGDWGFLAHSTP